MSRIFTLAAALLAVAGPALADGDAAKGETEFRKCKSCHAISSAEEDIVKGGKTGPNLFGVIGRTAGTAEGYSYGPDMVKAGEAGLVWDEAKVATYLEDPRGYLQETLGDTSARTKMTFKLKKGGEDVAAYLATFGAE